MKLIFLKLSSVSGNSNSRLEYVEGRNSYGVSETLIAAIRVFTEYRENTETSKGLLFEGAIIITSSTLLLFGFLPWSIVFLCFIKELFSIMALMEGCKFN